MPWSNEEWVREWAAADRSQRYRMVELQARAALDALEPDATLSTHALTEALFPQKQERGPGIAVRKAIIVHLMTLAKNTMRDCATKDITTEPRIWYGKAVRPWIWKRGNAARKPRCPCCQGKGYRDEADVCQAVDTPALA